MKAFLLGPPHMTKQGSLTEVVTLALFQLRAVGHVFTEATLKKPH